MWILGLKGLTKKKQKRCHLSFIQSLSVEIDGILVNLANPKSINGK